MSTGLRHRDKTAPKIAKSISRYRVDRWRIDEHEYQTAVEAAAQVQPSKVPTTDHDIDDIPAQAPPATFPLPSDQLLHLIQYNVLRALGRNKETLSALAVEYCAVQSTRITSSFPNHSVIWPASPTLSTCLSPTARQMKVAHSSWINILPFPTMRDRLIARESHFDHADFVRDLVGEQINLGLFLSTTCPASVGMPPGKLILQDPDLETMGSESRLVVWGEPYRAESWEASPGFLQKWAWCVTDCRELLDSTNHWRAVRGEAPLFFLSDLATTG